MNKDNDLSNRPHENHLKNAEQFVSPDVSERNALAFMGRVEERFSGPLAHPEHFKLYEATLPGSADRLLKMTEQGFLHEQNMQKAIIEGDIRDRKRGMYLGFCALLVLLLSALICVYLGRDWIAGVFLGAGALGVATAFINGRKTENTARQE